MKSEEEQLRELDKVCQIAKECDSIEEFNERVNVVSNFINGLVEFVHFYSGVFFWSVPRKRWYE